MEVSNTSSFPSTHTFISFCSATILTCCYRKKGAWSFILATLIAISRVFLCVHYPTDVLAGMVIGSGVGVAVYFMGKWLLDKIIVYFEKKKNNAEKSDALNSKKDIENEEKSKPVSLDNIEQIKEETSDN